MSTPVAEGPGRPNQSCETGGRHWLSMSKHGAIIMQLSVAAKAQEFSATIHLQLELLGYCLHAATCKILEEHRGDGVWVELARLTGLF